MKWGAFQIKYAFIAVLVFRYTQDIFIPLPKQLNKTANSPPLGHSTTIKELNHPIKPYSTARVLLIKSISNNTYIFIAHGSNILRSYNRIAFCSRKQRRKKPSLDGSKSGLFEDVIGSLYSLEDESPASGNRTLRISRNIRALLAWWGKRNCLYSP